MKIKAYFIIGLGNPGSQYTLTYHNVGWLALDYLIKTAAETMTFVQKGKQKNFEFFKFINDHNLIFIKPLTFMNESGKAVLAAMKYFKIKPEEILVIHDDSDIELDKLKLSFGRGAAGHKGVQSIIDELKTSAKGGSVSGGKNFSRLRIGIRPKASSVRRQASKRKEAGEMVLKKISPSDKLILDGLFNELKI